MEQLNFRVSLLYMSALIEMVEKVEQAEDDCSTPLASTNFQERKMSTEKSTLYNLSPLPQKIVPPEFTQEESDKYRFGGERYVMQGSAKWGPSDIIPKIPGLFAYPREDA